MVAPIVELEFVSKTFGQGPGEVRALRDVSLRIGPGEFVGLMGPSGCGKSTLLHVAGGLEEPSSGHVRVNGVDLATLDRAAQAKVRRREVGYVFQKLNLIPSLTAIENVMLPLEVDGMHHRAARVEAGAALALVGLAGPCDRFPDDFSGGQQQRIAIARALVGDRAVLLADEPTGALDTMNADSIIELLVRVSSETGAAVVLVTHEPRFASWADRVVFLRDGRIIDQTISAAPPAAETDGFLAGSRP
jgi:putative ABC transport system ATP-binding protein